MALDSTTIMLPGRGYILEADEGAPEPTYLDLEAFAANILTLPTGFTIIGHTSRKNLVALSKDGGNTTVLGSWEQEQIEEVETEKPVEYITVNGHQFDNLNLARYFGGGDITTPGRFVVSANPVPQKRALCIVYLTRGRVVGQYFASSSVRGVDAMEHSVEDFSTIPFRFTILDPLIGDRQVWIGRQFGAAVPADPGASAPAVTSLAPDTAAPADTVTVTGTDLTGATAVLFGATPATSFLVTNATTLTAVVPAGTGTVTVYVTTPAGTSLAVAGADFTYA